MDFFREGGWAMYPLLCSGLMGFVLGLAAVVLAFMKKRGAGIGLGAATIVLALLGCCVMGGGYYQARQNVMDAVSFVDPEHRAAILAQGMSEAMNILSFGVCSGALPMLFGLVALVRGITLPKPGNAPPGA